MVISLTYDEEQAVLWAVRKGIQLLKAEGWEDMRRNAEILADAEEKIKKAIDD